jgi:CheY-like chemotaxis protein
MSAYNIMIIDDDHKRLSAFKQALIGNALTMVSTAQDAINQLKLYRFALVFMDYDLDLNGELDAAVTGNGMDVVNWIVANKQHFLRTSFIIHSLNSIGAPLMVATLKTAGLHAQEMPGVWMDYDFLEKL